MDAYTQIARHLNIEASNIIRVEEWVFVWFVVVAHRGGRFVSKKVVKNMKGNIEFVQGQESHTSNWGKYYVKGLEAYQVKEDFDQNVCDKHHSYQGYAAIDVPSGTLFTIFEQSGDKHGTDVFFFSICVIDVSESDTDKACYGRGFCQGNYRVLARGETKTLAPRLMGWWIDSADKSLAFAEHCAAHIGKRGLKVLPAMV